MLSEHEQRALAELERCYAMEALEPVRSLPQPRRTVRRSRRSSGSLVVLLLGGVSFALLVAGVAAAALAIATATAIGWLFWRVWAHRADGGGIAASLLHGAGHGQSGSGRRPGESIRQYVRWLSEGE